MMSLTFITVVSLCSLYWISVSGSGSQTVEVQPGEEVTLRCSDISNYDYVKFWFRLVDRTQLDSCIAVLFKPGTKPSYCDGFKDGKFEMTSDISTIFLRIKQVELSDSGMYFCGFYVDGRPFFRVTHLNVAGSGEPRGDVGRECKHNSEGTATLTCFILAGLTVLLLMVIAGLIVQNGTPKTANKEDDNPAQTENLGSDDLNYAALKFRPKTARRRELESNVIYAATR